MGPLGRGVELGEAGEEARIAHELRRHPVIRVPSARCRCDHHARLERTDALGEREARVRRVGDAGVGQVEVLAQRHAHHARRRVRFAFADLGRAARAHLAGREVDDADALAALGVRDQRAAADEFDVIAVRTDGQQVEGRAHSLNLGGASGAGKVAASDNAL